MKPFVPAFGRKLLTDKDPSLCKLVYNFCFEHSRVAANRTSTKLDCPLRHLDDTISQLWIMWIDFRKYKSTTDYELHETTFRDWVKSFRIFVRPCRDSDMCPHCEAYKRLRTRLYTLQKAYKAHLAEKKQKRKESRAMEVDLPPRLNDKAEMSEDEIESESKEFESESEDSDDGESKVKGRVAPLLPISVLKNFVQESTKIPPRGKTQWTKWFSDLSTLVDHRVSVRNVNKIYDDDVKNTPPGTLVITADFKQNISIGNQQIEIPSDFRNKEARTILGFHLCSSKKRKYVDYISDFKSNT